jgi:predicted Rdx family selenoprotein
MSAARKLSPAPMPPATDHIDALGYHVFENGVNADDAAGLLAAIRQTRAFDASLFLSQAEFDANPQYTGVNPREGRNLLETFSDYLGFVENDPGVVGGLTAVLGEGYELLNRKIVCGVPASAVPAWLKRRITDNPVNNLGAYVRPPYRDVTYFYGIDFHQDIIDFKDREADFVTLYVYLHSVGEHDAPLFLLEDSHRLGATTFPHELRRDGAGFAYSDRKGATIPTVQKMLVGDAGYAAMWHPCTLHGTQPDAADNERLSLRYLFAKKAGAADAGIDLVNTHLSGPTRLSATRIDLDAAGAAVIKGNVVNQA